MKKIIFITLCLAVCGCSYEGKSLGSYLKDPRTIIRDPHFTEYKDKRDNLETQYLRKEISYADYVHKMDELDNQYSKEVEKREDIIKY